MRIAVVAGSFPKISETFVLDQIAGLVELGHDVRIFAFERTDEPFVHEKVGRYGLAARTLVLEAREQNLVSGAFSALPSVTRWIGGLGDRESLATLFAHGAQGSFDAIHCHFGHVAERARRLRRVGFFSGPLVAVFHAYDLTVVPRERGRDFYRPLFSEAARLLPITERWRRELIELGADPKLVEVRRMGVDLDAFSFRERNLTPGEPLRIVSVGRFVEKKGLAVAFEALALARSRLPMTCEYHVVGDGPLRAELERRVKAHDLSSVVTFHGPKSHADVAALLERMHLFVLPSVTGKDGDMEGLPVVLLEAMARGLPVVATRHSGIPEVVRDRESGLLVPEGDPKALANALVELAMSPTRWPSLGRAARQAVEGAHDAKRLARELADLFEKL
jgi:colanic acid/amylovoran biosynthesis glycosyltransferase